MKRCAPLARLVAVASGLCVIATPLIEARAAPAYEPTRAELEQVLEDLGRWLPGAWDSFPQVYLERTVRAPQAGEHEHWHRVFARIDAPQIGTHVFYGQINVGGRSGPVMPGSQILYNATIDEARGVVSIIGQGPMDRDRYDNLQDRPELWREVRQRDPGAVRCDFVWRRSGAQIVGVLEGRRPEARKYGPGTCTYMAGGNKDVEFFADAEWVLGPEELWLYDINKMAGRVFVGREDQTHIRLYRAHPFRCSVSDAAGTRVLEGHDRGFVTTATAAGGKPRELLLLRASLPRPGATGLHERLQLTLMEPGRMARIVGAEAAADASAIALSGDGIEAHCERAARFEGSPGVAAGR
jgi:hypothetical protein